MGKYRWRWDPNNWPDQRINWDSMPRPQKRYTIDQYNKSRSLRHLPAIPNPFRYAENTDDIHVNQDGTETITPRTVNRPRIQPLSTAPDPPAKRGHGPIIDAFAQQQITDDTNVEARINRFFNSNAGRTVIDNIIAENNNAESVQFAGEQAPHRPVNINNNVNEPQPGPSSAPDNTGEIQEPPAKRQRVDNGPPARHTEGGAHEDADGMSLPGSGMETEDHATGQAGGTAQAAAGGGRGFSGGFANATGPEVYVKRPQNHSNPTKFKFEKTHRILGYGIASVNLDHENSTGIASMRLMTTSLQEIPVDRPFFYLNPGEWESLQSVPGAHITKVKVTVVQRNPRVAFETGASTTSLATLNQNKFGLSAIGLNSKSGLRVTSRRISEFGTATEPMIPTATTVATYNDIDKAMYGSNQTEVDFNTTRPAEPFMIPMTIPNYLCCWNNGYDTSSNTRLATGWYSLNEHVTQFDMQATAGKVIVDYEYTPSYAPISVQLPYCEYLNGNQGGQNASNLQYNDGDATKQFTRINISGMTSSKTANPGETFSVSPTSLGSFDQNIIDRTALLEKGQILKNIDSSSNTKCVQPSLHIGISPVPRLTSSANTILPNSWTDVQSYYEIHTECWVEAFSPHHNTHQTQFHVETHDIKMGVYGIKLNSNYPVRFGKYAQAPITADTVNIPRRVVREVPDNNDDETNEQSEPAPKTRRVF